MMYHLCPVLRPVHRPLKQSSAAQTSGKLDIFLRPGNLPTYLTDPVLTITLARTLIRRNNPTLTRNTKGLFAAMN